MPAKKSPHSVRINTWAYANGYLCFDNEWTSDDARRVCLDRLAAHTRRDGDYLICRDGSQLEIDQFGMNSA